MKILIIGRGMVGDRVAKAWPDAVVAAQKIETLEDARRVLAEHKPDVVLNAAGVTGKPNVDWCDISENRMKTVVGNAVLPIYLAQATSEAGVYLLHIGSGCIYYGDSAHPDKAWREHDFGNPLPTYSRSKWAADLVLSTLPHVGIARIRMPIDYTPGPANLIDKLARYPKVIDVENSVTIVDDMVQVFRQLLEKKATGIFHVTNPGTVKHREIIAMYEELVDPAHTNEWITAEQLVEEGLATKLRSNNFLASERLAEFDIAMRPANEALRDTMQKYAALKRGENKE
ncbi:sugar nucleotide-binding protein [Patescibacteria group bacterium]|nr:sugar nucleotide-binding protein [Patescibacteria group bacterium]